MIRSINRSSPFTHYNTCEKAYVSSSYTVRVYQRETSRSLLQLVNLVRVDFTADWWSSVGASFELITEPKRPTPQFVRLEKFSLNFSSSSFAIRVNHLHPRTSLFLFVLFFSFFFSTLGKLLFKGFRAINDNFQQPNKQLKNIMM